MAIPQLSQLRLQRVTGDLRYEQPTLYVPRFEAMGPDLNLTASGTLGSSNGKIDAHVALQAPAKKESGALDMRLRVTGTVRQPRVVVESLSKKNFKLTVTKEMLQGLLREAR